MSAIPRIESRPHSAAALAAVAPVAERDIEVDGLRREIASLRRQLDEEKGRWALEMTRADKLERELKASRNGHAPGELIVERDCGDIFIRSSNAYSPQPDWHDGWTVDLSGDKPEVEFFDAIENELYPCSAVGDLHVTIDELFDDERSAAAYDDDGGW